MPAGFQRTADPVQIAGTVGDVKEREPADNVVKAAFRAGRPAGNRHSHGSRWPQAPCGWSVPARPCYSPPVTRWR